MTVGWACQPGLVGIVWRLCLDAFCDWRWIYRPKNMRNYIERGEGFRSEMYSQHCVKVVTLKFNLYMISMFVEKCHFLSSKASDEPNPKPVSIPCLSVRLTCYFYTSVRLAFIRALVCFMSSFCCWCCLIKPCLPTSTSFNKYLGKNCLLCVTKCFCCAVEKKCFLLIFFFQAMTFWLPLNLVLAYYSCFLCLVQPC